MIEFSGSALAFYLAGLDLSIERSLLCFGRDEVLYQDLKLFRGLIPIAHNWSLGLGRELIH